jgi:hypothetical protein
VFLKLTAQLSRVHIQLLEDEQKTTVILSGNEDGLRDLDEVELEVPQQQSKENDGSTSDQT